MLGRILFAVSVLLLVASSIGAGEAAPAVTPAIPTPKDQPLPKVPEGWKVEVIAEAPAILHPSVACYAPDGRLFVAEDPMDMAGPANKPVDRVLCIFPDGKTTVFAEGLYSVFGIQYLDGKVYIHHTPKFTVYRDENGVGKDPVDLIACTNPEPWSGTNLNDHIPANFRLAMDGYFYMSVGDKGIYGAVSSVDGKKAELFGGGILRIRPDGRDMEVYSTGTRNHLDISLNSEDEIFTYDNTDDGHGWWTRFTHMVDSGFYGYPYDYRPPQSDIDGVAKFRAAKGAAPTYGYTLWRMEEYGGGSPCGATGYCEDALPEEYRNNLYHCEWGKSEVDRFIVERDGGTYKLLKREPFITRADKGGEFRPLGITVTPDGLGFLICDWRFGGWKRAAQFGRLLKVTYTGKSLATPKPAWFVPASMGQKFEASTADLVNALKHPAQSVRLVAQRRLAERKDAVPGLIALLIDKAAPEFARWSAIWTLDHINEGKDARNAIIGLAKDEGTAPSIRMQAVRQLGTRNAKEAVQSLVLILTDPQNPALRFRAATALGRIGSADAAAQLFVNLTDKDFFTRYATFTALNRIAVKEPDAWQFLVRGLGSEEREIRDGCVYAMRDAFEEPLAKALAAQLKQTGASPEARAAALQALAQIAKKPKPWTGKWWGTQPINGARPAREVDWAGTPEALAAISAGLKDSNALIRTTALEALQLIPDPSAAPALAEMYKAEADIKLRKLILRALAASKIESAVDFTVAILKDPANAANKDLFGDALFIGKKFGTPVMAEAIAVFADADLEKDTLLAALDALEKFRSEKIVPVLVKRLAHEDTKVGEAALKALGNLKYDDSVAALIKTLEDKRAPLRRAAAKALEKLKPAAAVEPLLARVKDGEMRNDTILALAAMNDIRALDIYIDGLASKDQTMRDKCRNAIKSIHAKALPLIEKRLEAAPLSTVVVSELQTLYKGVLKEIPKDSKLFSYDTKALAPEAFAAYAATNKGDAENGKKLFYAADGIGCIKCHKIDNDGGEIGPALTGVASKYDRTKLIEDVLFPNKVILDGYTVTTVRTNDGQTVVGVVRGDTDAAVTLLDATGAKTEIKKDNIKTRKDSHTSLMPEGLHTALKPEEFADLITYLETLKEKKK